MTLGLVAVSPASAKQIPDRCTTANAPRLCGIHFFKHRADHYRSRMGEPQLPYHWAAEAHPERRSRILGYWMHTSRRARHRLVQYQKAQQAAPWLHGTWYQDALCVHHYEGAWNANTGNGYYGGMQMDISFQQSYGSQYVVVYGTADRWPVADQLHAAYRAWQSRGWTPWPNTARMCGLL